MLALLETIFTTILMTYLAFTQGLADGISKHLPSTSPLSQNSYVEVIPNNHQVTKPEINSLPSEYEFGGPIPRILRENAHYQQATVTDGLADIGEQGASTIFDALVNIYCTFTTEKYTRSTTGTGFFIDARGVILTNAHVAQFLLLESVSGTGETECHVRTGTPATAKYVADLLYISPSWIQKNASLIGEMKPQGTGERDYALLYVRGGLDNRPTPGSFPALSIDTSLMKKEDEGSILTVAGYPAESTSDDSPLEQLIPRSATSTITELFTFSSSTADVIAVGGSAIGVGGSSGGPAIDEQGRVIGLIVTKGDDTMDGTGSLRALTLSYINRTMQEETGFSIKENISGDLAYRAELFKTTLGPFLSRWLESELR